jgi:acetyltransferase
MVVVRRIECGSEYLLDQLIPLLQNVVEQGASIGFVLPLTDEIARSYWQDVFAQVEEGLALWVAEQDGRVVGTVQCSPCMKPNGMHRADVQKLMVHSTMRGNGISSQLLNELERWMREQNRFLMVLDTEANSTAAKIYERWNWQRVGEIPQYAGLPTGELIATCYYYKILDPH